MKLPNIRTVFDIQVGIRPYSIYRFPIFIQLPEHTYREEGTGLNTSGPVTIVALRDIEQLVKNLQWAVRTVKKELKKNETNKK